jgi:serine protease Do
MTKKIKSKSRNPGNTFISITPDNSTMWRIVQKQATDTVVQLFVQHSIFNWLEPHKSPVQRESSGSGFFIDGHGYIISNYHVIDEAIDIKIQIPSIGKQRFDLEVVGVCPARDIALLKLTKTSFKDVTEKLNKIPFIKFGDSDQVVRTQEILALGYPLGQEKLKATQGIVSGRERMWDESYIQITAALNEGNSGGPSLSINGEVIGINTAGIAKAQNIGYIIPINDVKNVISDLRKSNFLRKPQLGCEFNFSNKDMVKFLKNPRPGGLYISKIHKNSLLGKVGIKEGDMLYEINDYKVDLYGDISVDWAEDKISILDLLNRFTIDQPINLVIYRNGKEKKIKFNFEVVKELPIRTIYTPYENVDYEIFGGMIVMNLTINHAIKMREENPFIIKYWQRENQNEPKLIITHIFPDSETQKARVFYPGTILSEVNGKEVKTLLDFRKLIKESKKTGFLTIKSEDKQFMVLSLEKIIQEESSLASKYIFKKSKLIEALKK